MGTKGPVAGELAPDFELKDAQGTAHRLSALRGRTVVLYFYPKDDTPGCTVQACTFRDHYEEFTKAGAVVVGVSRDDAQAHTGFASKYKLPFTLLTDRDSSVHRAYGVGQRLGILSGRITYVIDREGRVRLVFDSPIRMKAHVEKALEVVRSLEASTPA